MTPAIVFQSKENERLYLANDASLVYQTSDIEHAMMIYRKDYCPPMTEDLNEFYSLISEHPGAVMVKRDYIPIYVQLTDRQLAEIEERGGRNVAL